MFLGNIKLLSTQLAMIADRLDFYIVNTLGNPAGASIGYTNCITSTGTFDGNCTVADFISLCTERFCGKLKHFGY